MNKAKALETLQILSGIVANLQTSNLKVGDAWSMQNGFAQIAEFITKLPDETTP